MEKSLIKALYLMQVTEQGISKGSHLLLSDKEKSFLEEKNGKYYLKAEQRAKIKVGLTGGAFDGIHFGHVKMLEEARQYIDVLVVVVAKNEMIVKKGREPVHNQHERVAMVNAMKYVDLALHGVNSPAEVLSLISPDVIFYGYDQDEFVIPKGVKIIKLHAYNSGAFKTTKLIEAKFHTNL